MSNRLKRKPCEYVLLAEFDIDEGSMLRHEYPGPTGCDEHLLAELMLPDGAHQRTEDWTIFYLNQTRATTVSKQLLNGGDVEKSNNGFPSDTEGEDSSASPGEPGLLYVMSLVRTKHSSAYKRGALVKALAVCSSWPYIQIFKPVLLLALEDYFHDPTSGVLQRMYEAINAIDTSLAPTLSLNERMVLRSSERKDLFEEKFVNSSVGEPGPSPLSGKRISHSMQPTAQTGVAENPLRANTSGVSSDTTVEGAAERARVISDNAVAHPPGLVRDAAKSTLLHGSRSKGPRDTHYFDTNVVYNELTLPIRIPLYTFPDEVGDYSLISLISTFSNFTSTQGPQHTHLHTNGTLTHPIIVLFNALVTYKRILFLGGATQPASHVSNFVLSAAALGSGCGMLFGSDMTERCFPYSNLTNLDNVLGVPGYVAGVSNPRFEDLTSTWDVLCNIETGRIHISKDIQQTPSSSIPYFATSTNASQLSLSTSSVTTQSSVPPVPSLPANIKNTNGHASELSQDFSSGSPEPPSATSGNLPFGTGGDGIPNSNSDSDMGRGLGREPSMTSSNGHSGVSIPAPSSASFAPTVASASNTATSLSNQSTRVEARLDTFDNAFIDEITAAIQSHFGEGVIRGRFTDYCRRFVRLASRYEEETYGATSIDYPTLPFIPGRLGSGLVFSASSSEEIKRELQANAGRIEGWRRTKCYEAYKRDWMLYLQSPEIAPESFARTIIGVDLHHQIARMRNSKKLSIEEVAHVYHVLQERIKSDSQVIELLSHLPSHFGGLLPLSFGLFHPYSTIRQATVNFLNTINAHPTGSKFVQSLNAFHRLAYARLSTD